MRRGEGRGWWRCRWSKSIIVKEVGDEVACEEKLTISNEIKHVEYGKLDSLNTTWQVMYCLPTVETHACHL